MKLGKAACWSDQPSQQTADSDAPNTLAEMNQGLEWKDIGHSGGREGGREGRGNELLTCH